jgi:hypothetical protein
LKVFGWSEGWEFAIDAAESMGARKGIMNFIG